MVRTGVLPFSRMIMRKPFTYYFDGRLMEWCLGVATLALSLECTIWPDTLKASAFQWLVVFVPSGLITVVLFIVGSVRIGAILANGYSLWIGPYLRSYCALLSSVMWFQFGTALVKLSEIQGFASPGIPFWYSFMFAELYITYRAVLDVRTRR